MKERPILFSTPMVNAILGGRKTQTRRAVKNLNSINEPLGIKCPYKCDRLWVRESWSELDSRSITPGFIYKANVPNYEGLKWKPSIHMPKAACRLFLDVVDIRYERLQDISDNDAVAEGISGKETLIKNPHDPDHIRYQDYSMDCDAFLFGRPKCSFRSLWEKINGDNSWDLNPWVWVIEFKKVEVQR